MKKRIVLLLTLALALTMLTACGANTSAPAVKGDYIVEETAAEAPAAMMMDASSNVLAGAVLFDDSLFAVFKSVDELDCLCQAHCCQDNANCHDAKRNDCDRECQFEGSVESLTC